jgi:multidrug efflux system membrane fusion protein
VLAQIDARPYRAALNVALAKKAQDQAMLTKARGDLARFQTLNKSQFTSQQTLEAQQALVAQAEATLKGDEAVIENARVQLGYTTISAPVSGRIGLRQVDVGNILRASDNVGLAVISQVHPISVIFSLPASELNIISKVRSQTGVPVIAYSSDDREKLAEGTLLTVDSAVDETNGSIKLKATFANESNRLVPGQSVSAHILLDTQSDVLTVPARAVQRGPNGLFVYALKPDSTVEVRPIETSETVGDKMVLVSTTLAEGDTVITGGQARLEPGAKVAVRSETKTEIKDASKGG